MGNQTIEGLKSSIDHSHLTNDRVNGSQANLANSTSVVTAEFQSAEYKCETAGYVLPDGSDTFYVQVRNVDWDGRF